MNHWINRTEWIKWIVKCAILFSLSDKNFKLHEFPQKPLLLERKYSVFFEWMNKITPKAIELASTSQKT